MTFNRQAMAEREPTPAAELQSIQNRPGHSPLRTFKYDCGHEHVTALLSPPKDCQHCRTLRWLAGDAERRRRAMLAKNRTAACEEAGRAHNYGKPHLICLYCVESRAVDAKALTEAHAGIFSKRDVRGFKFVGATKGE